MKVVTQVSDRVQNLKFQCSQNDFLRNIWKFLRQPVYSLYIWIYDDPSLMGPCEEEKNKLWILQCENILSKCVKTTKTRSLNIFGKTKRWHPTERCLPFESFRCENPIVKPNQMWKTHNCEKHKVVKGTQWDSQDKSITFILIC